MKTKSLSNVSESLRDFAANLTDVSGLSENERIALNSCLYCYRHNHNASKLAIEVATKAMNRIKELENEPEPNKCLITKNANGGFINADGSPCGKPTAGSSDDRFCKEHCH